MARWAAFADAHLAGYGGLRDRADLPGTSRLSRCAGGRSIPGPCWPRSTLIGTAASSPSWGGASSTPTSCSTTRGRSPGTSIRRSIEWRTTSSTPTSAFAAWAQGRTGFPFVDAGMRQLRAEGWMHNRVRMVVASLPGQGPPPAVVAAGSGSSCDRLVDGDPASNAHGWQWVAGHRVPTRPRLLRVFNPVLQGDEVRPRRGLRRRVRPELAHLWPAAAAHEPWEVLDGYAHGYPRADRRPCRGARRGPSPVRRDPVRA